MRYYIIAGEASGDLHGSNLVRAIREADPQAVIRGWGGDLMKAEGADIVKHIRELAFMGFVEVLKNLRTIRRNFAFCKQDIEAFAPDVLVCIDYPGFNLRMCKWAKQKGYRTALYIAPQAWAWKEKRAYTLPGICDEVISILPFEEAFFARFGTQVRYVGHPLADAISRYKAAAHPPIPELTTADKPLVALLPGSRRDEIKNMLPVFMQVRRLFPQYRFVIAGAPALDMNVYRRNGLEEDVPVVFGHTYACLAAARAAIVTSGTATLETALLDTPQTICYKGNPISYQIVKRLIKIPYVSLVNLILGRPLLKEYLQYDLTVDNITAELKRLMEDGEYRQTIRSGYAELRTIVGDGGASRKAADIIVRLASN